MIDASFAKAPEGGEDTGPNPTDRSKSGSKHHVMTDAQGVPLAATVTRAPTSPRSPRSSRRSTTCRRWAASRGRSGRSPTACRGIGATTRNRCGRVCRGGDHAGAGGPQYGARQRFGQVPLVRRADHRVAALLRPAAPPFGSAHRDSRRVPQVSMFLDLFEAPGPVNSFFPSVSVSAINPGTSLATSFGIWKCLAI